VLNDFVYLGGGHTFRRQWWRAELIGGVDHDLPVERAQLLEHAGKLTPRHRNDNDFSELDRLPGSARAGAVSDFLGQAGQLGRLAAERQPDLVPGGAQLSGDPAADPSCAYDPDLQRPSSFGPGLTALATLTVCSSAFPRSA